MIIGARVVCKFSCFLHYPFHGWRLHVNNRAVRCELGVADQRCSCSGMALMVWNKPSARKFIRGTVAGGGGKPETAGPRSRT